jgi:hypothetical protein
VYGPICHAHLHNAHSAHESCITGVPLHRVTSHGAGVVVSKVRSLLLAPGFSIQYPPLSFTCEQCVGGSPGAFVALLQAPAFPINIPHSVSEGSKRCFTVAVQELFGPLSMRALEDDKYVRQIDGYLPDATVAFIDEIFKANSAILNTLLTILNERLFDNGSDRIRVPLACLVRTVLAARFKEKKDGAGGERERERGREREIKREQRVCMVDLAHLSRSTAVCPERVRCKFVSASRARTWIYT